MTAGVDEALDVPTRDDDPAQQFERHVDTRQLERALQQLDRKSVV